MVEQKFDELGTGTSGAAAPTEETPGDEFVWTDESDKEGEGAIGVAGLPGAQRQPVILSDIPEFRQHQSKIDLRIKALTAQLAGRDTELAQLRADQRKSQDRLDADRLRNATPQQIHAYYQERSQRDAAEHAALTEGQALEQQIATRAGQVLQAVGMNRETAGLRFGTKVDMLSYVDLLESVVEVQNQNRAASGAEGGTRQVAVTTEPPEPGAQVGVQTPPVTRGRVSTARGQPPRSLWSAYYKALDRIEQGDYQEVVALRLEYQKKGLDFDKMPKRRRR